MGRGQTVRESGYNKDKNKKSGGNLHEKCNRESEAQGIVDLIHAHIVSIQLSCLLFYESAMEDSAMAFVNLLENRWAIRH